MKKLTKITLYSVAVLAASVGSVPVFADDNVPATADLPITTTTTEPTVPSTPTVPSNSNTVVPIEPTVPSTPTVPSNSNTVVPTEPTVPSDPTVSSNSNTVVPTEPTVPSDPTVSSNSNTVVSTEPSTTEPVTTTEATSSSGAGEGTVTVPTVSGGTAAVTQNPSVPTNNPNISAQTALSVGASQVGTTSTVTGQVVQNVTANAPIQTNTGHQIVSTVDSQIVVAYADGSTATINPSNIGGIVNEDKTISITAQSGEMKTLPHTGEKETTIINSLGVGLLAVLLGYFIKKKSLKGN